MSKHDTLAPFAAILTESWSNLYEQEIKQKKTKLTKTTFWRGMRMTQDKINEFQSKLGKKM